MALKNGDRSALKWILDRTPDIPEDCQWCTFLRNHDELTLEMVSEEERQWMWQEYAPHPRMRLNLGIRRRLAPLLDNDRRKIELAYSLLFTLPGSPIIYYGDEIGMGDNIWLPDRNGVRTPMQWTNEPDAGFSEGAPGSIYTPIIQDHPYSPDVVNVNAQLHEPDSLLNRIRKLISIRKQNPVFSTGELIWIDEIPSGVAGYWRTYNNVSILVLNNLSDQPQQVRINLPDGYPDRPIDLLSGAGLNPVKSTLKVRLQPFQFRWIRVF